MEEEKILAEYHCGHRTDADETWVGYNIRPTDLRLRVLSSNLVMFDFMTGEDIIGSYRLCWNGFSQFVASFRTWFFEEDPHEMIPSCVDGDQSIRCMVHSDYVVSLTIGSDQPEFVFYANRADVLTMFDNTMRVVDEQPDVGCYKLKTEGSSGGVSWDEDAADEENMETIEERFAKLSQKGQTVH